MKRQQHLSLSELQASFPTSGKYRNGPWQSQEQILEFVSQRGTCIVESPTGTGKTAVEYAILKAAQNRGDRSLFLITPNKTIVQQISREFPEVRIALGRNEHRCLYYQQAYRADEVPCSMLLDCPHRVNQTTGETCEAGTEPCPYLQQKYEAKQGGIVVCTMAFYLFTHLFDKEAEEPDLLVIDEAHRIAEVFRNSLSYEITDHHLRQSAELLKRVGIEEHRIIRRFRAAMRQICRKRPPEEGVLLEDEELRRLINILSLIDARVLSRKIRDAVKSGRIDEVENRASLKRLEVLVRDIGRYMSSFEYSLGGENRGPLNYTYAFYREEIEENQRVQHKLVIKCYYVVPLIRKVLPSFHVSFSATIGDIDTFGFECGISGPYLRLGSNFPAEHTRVYMPTDTPNLAVKSRNKRDVTKAIRAIARACKQFSDRGARSLVVTISNREREKFLELAREEGLNPISYGNGATAREVAQRFKEGEGDVLVGTAANYSEGVDLPQQIAPIIFFLRPGYPNPNEPGTIFEERRFGSRRWALWNWRVMQQALQVRGRNVRSRSDTGVTFFVSQQFRRFVYASLPAWLEKAYRGTMTLEECIEDAKKLIQL